MCFGTCPAYRLRIDRAGLVVFEPRGHTKVSAPVRYTVASWVFDSLALHLSRIGFSRLPDNIEESALCSSSATDHPTVIVSLFGTSAKRVVYYTGCKTEALDKTTSAPVALGQFAAGMDSLTGAHRLIRPDGIQ